MLLVMRDSSASCDRMSQRRLGAPRSPEGESESRLCYARLTRGAGRVHARTNSPADEERRFRAALLESQSG
jgi:hypothetical protein